MNQRQRTLLALHQAVFEWSEEDPMPQRLVYWYGTDDIQTLQTNMAIRATLEVVDLRTSDEVIQVDVLPE